MAFRPDIVAKRVCLVFGQETTAFSRRLVDGVIEYGRRNPHFHIAMHQAAPYVPWERLGDHPCDGIIAAAYEPSHVQQLRTAGVPVVNVSSMTVRPALVTVCTDNHRIGQLAAAHLLEKNLEHFAFVGLDPPAHDEFRLAGFRELLARRKLGCVKHLVRRDSAAVTQGAAYKAFVASLPRPVGVMASNDKVAFGLLDACRLLGLAVPDQVAVIGCDNDETLCQLAYVTLTSVDPAADVIGQQAAEMLDRLMHGRRVGQTPLRVPPRGVEARNSTDVRGLVDAEVAAAVRFIRDHAAAFIDVTDVLRVVPVSRRALERRFQDALGHGIYEEIHRVHIERAKGLLADPELSLTRTALGSGYHGVTRFQANFLRIVGMTPADYRRTLAKPPPVAERPPEARRPAKRPR